MATGLPLRLDVPRLADQGAEFAGRVPLERLSRLRALLSAPTGEAGVQVRLARDPVGRALVQGAVEAELVLTCQRCLEPVSVPVRAGFLLAVVADEAAAAALPDEYEPLLLAGREADLLAVVEDELLLAVPQVPMHPDAVGCGPQVAQAAAAPQEARRNPFAALAGLKERN